ncbi:MAG: hypothetical protein IJM60_09290 [Bacteroidales bacterium]|nr:hypothetical protein [Bacteroidales bacterium]
MRKIHYFLIGMLMLLSFSAGAQNEAMQRHKEWHEKMKAEKIAYLTNAVGLTSAEAEKFWPVYNKAEMEKFQAFRKIMETYKALDDAVKAEKKDKEIEKLLDAYLSSLSAEKAIDAKYTKQYRAILPEIKVAKLFLAEESFRRSQINRLGKRGGGEAKPEDKH